MAYVFLSHSSKDVTLEFTKIAVSIISKYN